MNGVDRESYPWYRTVDGDNLEQGDIIDSCPVFVPSEQVLSNGDEPLLAWEDRDVIVMTQSCDLVAGREKVTEILLCPVWLQSELTEGYLATLKGLEDARRGNLPGYHILAPCQLPEYSKEVRVVDFRRVYSLPLNFFRRQAAAQRIRIRLMPPYREHLAQAFARFFMRIGLPTDIPPFVRK